MVGVFHRGSFAGFNKQLDIWHLRLSLDAQVNGIQQLDLHWVAAGIYLVSEVAASENVKGKSEAAKTGLCENVVRFVECVVAGDAHDFRKAAVEVNLDRPVAGDHLTGQRK